MALPLLLAAFAQAIAPPAVSPAAPVVDPATVTLPSDGSGRGDSLDDPPAFRNGQPYPPTGMIDFLGRRLLCARLIELSSDPPGERARLRCAELAGEEQALRQRHAGDRAVLRWLDQNPLEFRLARMAGDRTRRLGDVWPDRMEQSGTDPATGQPYRILIETRIDGGRSTRITAAFDRLPARSFTLDNRVFPLLDLQSLTTMLLPPRPDDEPMLMLFLYYGHPRGYCSDEDDRPRVQISFGRRRAYGADFPRTNCEHDRVPIADAAAR